MMLDWLGENYRARVIEAAVASVVAAGNVRTYDMGGTASTLEMARATAEAAESAMGRHDGLLRHGRNP